MADYGDVAEGIDAAGHAAPTAPAPRTGEPARVRRARVPVGLIVMLLVVLALAAGGTYYWYLTKDEESTDDAYTDGRAVMIAPQVNGEVVTLAVTDNQFVHMGDLLVKIDPRLYSAARDQAQGQLALAEAQLNLARTNRDLAHITYPARLASAQAAVEVAKTAQWKADADFKRQKRINPQATMQETIDAVTAAARQATAQVAQAEAQLAEAQVVDPQIAAAEAQVKQAEAQVTEARAQLQQAMINLGYTNVAAPQDGWVTKRNVEQGNFVAAGTQIMALVTPQVWVTANFKESQLARMRPGQAVAIHVDAYPQLDLKGHVDSVQLGSGSKFTAFPPENATGNFVKIVQRVPVKIDIDSGLDPKLPLPLGISVVPTVALK